MLIAHRPFSSTQPYAETGPIFIHERECAPYEDASVYPSEFPRDAVVLRAYSDTDEIVGAELVDDRRVEDIIAVLLESPGVAFLHARNAAYGCFMFRIERA